MLAVVIVKVAIGDDGERNSANDEVGSDSWDDDANGRIFGESGCKDDDEMGGESDNDPGEGVDDGAGDADECYCKEEDDDEVGGES